MTGLPDLEPTETVMVGKKSVAVVGVSFKEILALSARFPELGALFGGGGDFGAATFMAKGDAVVSAIIAAGIGHPGDKDEEAKASRLPLETQLDLVAAVIRVTMPSGVGPFVEKLTALTAALNVEAVAAPTPGKAAPVIFPLRANVTRVKHSTTHLNS